jgi:hypothetical protein
VEDSQAVHLKSNIGLWADQLLLFMTCGPFFTVLSNTTAGSAFVTQAGSAFVTQLAAPLSHSWQRLCHTAGSAFVTQLAAPLSHTVTMTCGPFFNVLSNVARFQPVGVHASYRLYSRRATLPCWTITGALQWGQSLASCSAWCCTSVLMPGLKSRGTVPQGRQGLGMGSAPTTMCLFSNTLLTGARPPSGFMLVLLISGRHMTWSVGIC